MLSGLIATGRLGYTLCWTKTRSYFFSLL